MRPRRIRIYRILLLVVVLLVVAVGLGYLYYMRSQTQQKKTLVYSDIAVVGILAGALQDYADRHGGDYPASLDELAGKAFETSVLFVPSLSELSGKPQRFLYRPGCNVAQMPARILVHPPPELQKKYYPNGLVFVIMTDGSVRKCLTYAEFEELLTVQAKTPASTSSPATEPAP